MLLYTWLRWFCAVCKSAKREENGNSRKELWCWAIICITDLFFFLPYLPSWAMEWICLTYQAEPWNGSEKGTTPHYHPMGGAVMGHLNSVLSDQTLKTPPLSKILPITSTHVANVSQRLVATGISNPFNLQVLLSECFRHTFPKHS